MRTFERNLQVFLTKLKRYMLYDIIEYFYISRCFDCMHSIKKVISHFNIAGTAPPYFLQASDSFLFLSIVEGSPIYTKYIVGRLKFLAKVMLLIYPKQLKNVIEFWTLSFVALQIGLKLTWCFVFPNYATQDDNVFFYLTRRN